MRIAGFLFVIFFGVISRAYEVDNFTYRDKPIKDSMAILDEEVERRLKLALVDLQGQSCAVPKPKNETIEYQVKDEAVTNLINSLVEQFGSGVVGELETFAEKFSPDNQKFFDSDMPDRSAYIHIVPYEKSIFRNSKGLMLNLVQIGANIKVNGVYLGTDKLGHFFVEGFKLYNSRPERQGVKNSLSGMMKGSELFLEGKSTTGVTSYADMAANYEGSRFWNNVWRSEDPYFKCKDDRWVRTAKKFTFADFVTDGFDEAINCSNYDKSIRVTLPENISCPVDAMKCQKLVQRYRAPVKDFILYPKCSTPELANSKSESNSNATEAIPSPRTRGRTEIPLAIPPRATPRPAAR